MIRAITANRLKPVIDGCFPLEVIVAAFRHYESQKHFGKVCIELKNVSCRLLDAAGGEVWPRKPTVEVTSASVAGDSESAHVPAAFDKT